MQRRFVSALVVSALMLSPMPAFAKSASDLRDLVGARAAGAEQDLRRRGFVLTDGHQGESTSYTYWWNGAKNDCVMVETRDGRYSRITDVSAADCNQQNHHGSTGAIVAGAAVAAIIGAALLSHKSGHHDDNQHYSDSEMEAEYERGYRDGLHGQAVNLRNRSESYRSGYRNGVDQRARETHYDPSDYGYGGTALNLQSLVGGRAAGVETELRSNGFRDVDTFSSGNNGRGIVWWSRRSRQCVQVITVNGRADSVTDIGTHPRCR